MSEGIDYDWGHLISMNPKLVPCQTCQKEISADAVACPYCGAPNKKKRGLLRKLALTGIAVIGLAIIGALLDDTASTAPGSGSTGSSPAGAIHRLNEAVRAGHMEWNIGSVKIADGFSSEFSSIRVDSSATMLVQVTGTVTNRSSAEDTSLGNLYLVDASGARYGERGDAAQVSNPLALDSFNPNVPKKFSTVFEIPRSARGVKFEATDFASFSPETTLIDLGLDK